MQSKNCLHCDMCWWRLRNNVTFKHLLHVYVACKIFVLVHCFSWAWMLCALRAYVVRNVLLRRVQDFGSSPHVIFAGKQSAWMFVRPWMRYETNAPLTFKFVTWNICSSFVGLHIRNYVIYITPNKNRNVPRVCVCACDAILQTYDTGIAAPKLQIFLTRHMHVHLPCFWFSCLASCLPVVLTLLLGVRVSVTCSMV